MCIFPKNSGGDTPNLLWVLGPTIVSQSGPSPPKSCLFALVPDSIVYRRRQKKYNLQLIYVA